jgi:hypothetical protein
MRYNTLQSHSQNASKLLTEKIPKYSKPRSFTRPLAYFRPPWHKILDPPL